MTDTIRDLLISLATHMAYMQGHMEAHYELEDPEDYWWVRESIALRQKVTDVLADEPAVPDEGRDPAAVITEPSDPELADAYWKAWHGHNGRTLSASHYAGLRAVLARWGHQPAPPADGEVAELVAWLRREFMRNQRIGDRTSALQSLRAAELLQRQALVPVSVSERLPGPEDCDAEGKCWLCGKVEGDWRLINPEKSGVPHLKYCFTHWLPAHALPLPEVEA